MAGKARFSDNAYRMIFSAVISLREAQCWRQVKAVLEASAVPAAGDED